MNINAQKPPRIFRLSYLTAALLMASAVNAHAGQPCALYEGTALTMMATSAAGQNNRNRLAVGTGYQHGSVALSVGYQRLIDEKSTFTIGGAIGAHGENTVGAGYGFGW